MQAMVNLGDFAQLDDFHEYEISSPLVRVADRPIPLHLTFTRDLPSRIRNQNKLNEQF